MKSNRKSHIDMTDGELREFFSEFFEGSTLEKSVSDARKAFIMLSQDREFNEGGCYE